MHLVYVIFQENNTTKHPQMNENRSGPTNLKFKSDYGENQCTEEDQVQPEISHEKVEWSDIILQPGLKNSIYIDAVFPLGSYHKLY